MTRRSKLIQTIKDKSVLCVVCHARTTRAPWRGIHCPACWDRLYPEHAKAQQQKLIDELTQDEDMGAGCIPARPPGDSIRKVHRPGTMKWDGTHWVLARNKPSLS